RKDPHAISNEFVGRPGYAGTELAQTEQHAGASQGTGSERSAILSAASASTAASSRALSKQALVGRARPPGAPQMRDRTDGSTIRPYLYCSRWLLYPRELSKRIHKSCSHRQAAGSLRRFFSQW